MKDGSSPAIEELALPYWHAAVAFGVEAVEKVISQPVWSRKYPDVISGVLSHDVRTKHQTVLPGEVVYEIAGHPECLYDFHENANERLIYASFRDKPLVAPFDVSNARRIERQKALLWYGAYCLFKAAEHGVGRKGE